MTRKEKHEKLVVDLFHRNGYKRSPVEDRLEEDSQVYKKGWEIRFAVFNAKELKGLLKSLTELGFDYGKPYAKKKRTIVPIYGRKRVERFDEILDRHSKN